MGRDLNETRRTEYHQIENINKNTEIIKRNQREILELKIIITENFIMEFQI